MRRLRFHFFGRFQATLDEQPLTVYAPRNQALLLWLSMQPDHSASREATATLLWPESDAQRAHQNLRKTLSRLRKSFGDVIDGTRWQISLAQDSWQSDAADFLDRLAQGDLEQAVALYDGQLLAGVASGSLALDEWLLLKREAFQRDYLQALAALTERAFDEGHIEAAFSYTQRTIAADPFDEHAYCDQMEALALLNRQREAMALFERLEELLSAELNIAPGSDTVALYQQIKDGSYGTRKQRDITVDATPPPNNLPRLHSKFIGRTQLKSRAVSHLGDANCNLLTLVGIGGVGKTRLSLAIGEALLAHFPDGVWFVPLESASSEAGIVDAVAAALGIEISSRMFDPADRLAHVVGQLTDRRLLILLDNYESVIDHVALVQALIAEAAQVKLLVTSRERLRLQSEWVIDVDGLAVPPENGAEDSRAYAAVQLFEEAALRIGADIDPVNPSTQQAVATIARDVGGVPLAIELAAAWCRSFSAETVAARIASSIDFLETQLRDATPRHRSIRAVFEQTWEMLTPEEQSLFERLAIFSGGFTLSAAQHILAADAQMLAALGARALLIIDGDRYSMHPLIRQFAAEKWGDVSAETAQQVGAAHAHFFADWLASFEAIYKPATRRAMQPDMENSLAAWRWASAVQDLDLLNQLRPNFFAYYDFSGAHHELYAEFDATQGRLESAADPSKERLDTRAWILLDMAEVSYKFSRFEQAIEEVDAAEQIGLLTEEPRLLVRAYARKIGCKNMLGQREDVAALGQQALDAVSAEDEAGLALIYGQLSTSAELDGKGERALEYSKKEVDILRRLNEPTRLAIALIYLGIGYASTGRPERRVALTREAYEIFRDAEITYESCGTGINLAVGLADIGDFVAAGALYEELIVTARQINEQRMIAVILWNLSDVYLSTRKYDLALKHVAEAITIYAATEDKFGAAGAHETHALIHSRMGDLATALKSFEVAIKGYEEGDYAVNLGAAHSRIGSIAVSFNDLAMARKQVAIVEQLPESSDNAIHVSGLAVLKGRIALATEQYAAALDHFRAAKAQAGGDGGLDVLTGEALALLKTGASDEALVVVESILAKLADETALNQTENVPSAYVACVEVLRARGDGRAAAVLAAGLAFLDGVSAEISDPVQRENYLNRITYNRQLLALAN